MSSLWFDARGNELREAQERLARLLRYRADAVSMVKRWDEQLRLRSQEGLEGVGYAQAKLQQARNRVGMIDREIGAQRQRVKSLEWNL